MSLDNLPPRINQWLYEPHPFSCLLEKIENKFQTHRVTVFYFGLAILMLILMHNSGYSRTVCMLMCTSYPSVRMIGSMESDDKTETGTWLLYWPILITSWPLLLLPYPYLFYSAFAFWLWFPVTNGVGYLYIHFVRPFAQLQHGNIDPEIWKELDPIFLSLLSLPKEDARLLQNQFDPDSLEQFKAILEQPDTEKKSGTGNAPSTPETATDVNIFNAMSGLSEEDAQAFFARYKNVLPTLQAMADLQRTSQMKDERTSQKKDDETNK